MNARKKRNVYAAAAAIARVNPHLSATGLARALGLDHAEGRELRWHLEDEGLVKPDIADALTRRWARAVEVADVAAVEKCLAEGFSVNTPIISRHAEPRWPLLYVCICCTEPQDLAILRLLLSAGADPNVRDEEGDAALMYVSHPTAIRLLLEAGANVTLRNRDGQSVLHYANRFADPESVRLLLAAGADPHAEDNEGCTPLFCRGIGLADSPDILSLLLQAGADLRHANHAGQTAVDDALTHAAYAHAALLLRHNAPTSPNALTDFLTRELTSDEGKEEVLKALLQQRIARKANGE